MDIATANQLRYKTKRQEALFYRRERAKSQELFARGPEATAKEFHRHCQWCEKLLVPEIREFLISRRVHLHPVFPSLCGCEGERDALMAEEARIGRAREEAEVRHWIETLEKAGLIGWLSRATFDSYLPREDWPRAMDCKATVQRYLRDVLSGNLGEKPWLILHGAYGTGKSHLAAAVVRECLASGIGRCYFRVWPEYLRRLLNSFDRRDNEERTSDIINELQRGRVIVIDDVDKRQPSKSGWTTDELYTVLNRRYNERAPTILTFNHAPDEIDSQAPGHLVFERYMGRAILDRIVGATYDVVNFDGSSYRWRD